MEAKVFSEIRHYLRKTQTELAGLLCVSPKAIQSFEQGWRNISASAERQLLVLLSLKKAPDLVVKPCWEIKECPDDWREKCVVWEYKVRHYCWLINGTYCQGQARTNWKKKLEVCWQCEVFRAILPPLG